MSFILDALRRADRERENERGGVPSLYTQATPSPIANPAADDGAPRPWLWMAAGLGGGLVLAAVWALWSATPAALPMAPAPSVPSMPPSPAPPTQAAATPSAPPPSMAATPPPTPAPAPVPSPQDARAIDAGRDALPAEPRRRPTATESARPTPPRTPEPTARERLSGTRSEAAPSPPSDDAGPARSAPPPIRQMSELSAEQRGRLPTLTFGGAMYSASAANRRLIVNGQLLSEGDAVAPGVTLEEIRLKSAVLRTKDLRVELGF